MSVIMPVLEGFASASLLLGITPILVGLAFMGSGKDALGDDFENLATLKGHTASGPVGAWMVHLIFFGGMCCWAWAITVLGLALGYESEVALCGGFVAWYFQFLYMAAVAQSPMGFPGFSGVPPPLRILFGIACASMITSVVLKAMDGTVPWSFYVVLVIGISGPQALGAKARAAGWEAPQPAQKDTSLH